MTVFCVCRYDMLFGEPRLMNFNLYERKINAVEYVERKCKDWAESHSRWYETYDETPDTWFLYEIIDKKEYAVVLKIIEREIE